MSVSPRPRPASLPRCPWAGEDPLYRAYHDREWGVPVHDDPKLFEAVVLQGAQAGLSWATILKKREHYRSVFDGFDPAVVARYRRPKLQALLRDPGIVRNRLKVEGAVRNAGAFLAVAEEFGSFDRYLWEFTGGRPQVNRFRRLSDLPPETPLSQALSRDLKRRGFTFVGPTICYALMQAVGMVNDHLVTCFRWKELQNRRKIS